MQDINMNMNVNVNSESESESESDYIFDQYLVCFHAFLDKHHLRKTYERNVILLAVYDFDKHFTIEDLYKQLKRNKCHVSQTTLYKTVSLLVEAGLLLKHYFPSEPSAQYEKFFNVIAHNHVYMEDTDEVFEFSDERIKDIITDIEKKHNIKVSRHSFTVYCKKNNQ